MPSAMTWFPSVLTTPDRNNAIIVYDGKMYQFPNNAGELVFTKIMDLYLDVERRESVAMFADNTNQAFGEGC